MTGSMPLQEYKVVSKLININKRQRKFLLSLVFWMGLVFLVVYNPWVISALISRLSLVITFITSHILGLFGADFTTNSNAITSKDFTMIISNKCTGIYQIAGFIAGVLSFPSSFRAKIGGILNGILLISLINLIRIISIFYVGISKPEWIPLFHGVIWETLMIVVTVIIWFWWQSGKASEPYDKSTKAILNKIQQNGASIPNKLDNFTKSV